MASANLKCGELIGDHYRVERLLGRSDLGCTYLCLDLAQKELLVSVRLLADCGGPERLTALRRELSLLTRFRHHQLVHYLGFGVTGRSRTPWVVRPYVEGADIFQGSEQWCPDRMLDHLTKICRVLHFLHTRGIVHRHLKPSNIILAGN
jgi:eukaryotic-like serine/threonine-protein kinase